MFCPTLYFMKRILIGICAIVLCLVSVSSAAALSVIRDTETENILLGYVRPIFKAAGLNPNNAQIVIVNDPSINAFVAGGQTIFIHTGLILKARYPDELVFVLAHETGHIVGGHVVRGYQALQNAQTTALISTVLGGLIAVAGGRPDAGVAVMMGGQSSALGLFTQYRQTEESSADRTAVDILKKTGYSMAGFEGIMKSIRADERLNNNDERSYLQTHPMTQTRISDLKRFLDNPLPLHQDQAFDLMRAKLSGFLLKPSQTKRLYTGKTIADQYALAIAAYKDNNFAQAFSLLNDLIDQNPVNPYFHELKGQFLFETGQLKKAAASYARANDLLPNEPLIQLSYAQVLLESGERQDILTAEKILKPLSQKEPDTPMVWQLLAKAYDRQRLKNEAGYAMAEYHRTLGHTVQARRQAKKSLEHFPKGTVIYQRLQDMIDLGK